MKTSRVTIWRHKTGRSKKRIPHGPVNYKAVAIVIAKRYYRDIWEKIQEDVWQEIEILCIEANRLKKIKGGRKRYGNGRDRMGIVQYSRAVHSRLGQVRKHYGFYRNKKFFQLLPKEK